MDPMDPKSSSLPSKIRYEYESDRELRQCYAHGVWGGVNPHGEVEMNFYVESDKLPDYSERDVMPDGTVGPEMIGESEQVKTIVRTIQSRVVLNYQTARAVIDWLEEKVRSLELETDYLHYPLEGERGPEQ